LCSCSRCVCSRTRSLSLQSRFTLCLTTRWKRSVEPTPLPSLVLLKQCCHTQCTWCNTHVFTLFQHLLSYTCVATVHSRSHPPKKHPTDRPTHPHLHARAHMLATLLLLLCLTLTLLFGLGAGRGRAAGAIRHTSMVAHLVGAVVGVSVWQQWQRGGRL
jgi:hypothetical protein